MRRRTKRLPWGRITGTLTAAVVTLVCVLRGIDPIEIVRRSVLAFVVVAAMTALIGLALQTLEKKTSAQESR